MAAPAVQHSYEGTFDGTAPEPTSGSALWNSSSWFSAPALVDAQPVEVAVAPGGARGQNRMLVGASCARGPFSPASASHVLAEGAQREGEDGAHCPGAAVKGARSWAAHGGRRLGSLYDGEEVSTPPLALCVPRGEGETRWRDARLVRFGELEQSPAPAATASVPAPRAAAPPPPPSRTRSASRSVRAVVEESADWWLPPAPAGAEAQAPARPGQNWTPFRLSSGDVVFLASHHGALTASLVCEWMEGSAEWPTLAKLSLSSVDRAQLPPTQPGPELVGAELQLAREEIAAWAGEERSKDQEALLARLVSAAKQPKLSIQAQLEAEKGYVSQLEKALRDAGVPLPSRAAVGVGAGVDEGSVQMEC